MFRATTPKNRRHVYWISNELMLDTTIQSLLNTEKWSPWFHGIDCSDRAFEESGLDGHGFFTEIKNQVEGGHRNSIVIFDDFQDSPIPILLRRYIDKLLRTGRHRGISAMSIQHSLRNSTYSKQSAESAKHIVIFPRSQKGKVINFLKDSASLPLGTAREIVALAVEDGRSAILRQHAPCCLISNKRVKLL
jgi:hypothetical protein